MKKVYLFFCLLLASMVAVQAQTKTWIGNAGGDSLWHNINNWSPSGIPTATDSVVFTNVSPISVTFNANASARVINLNGANVIFANKSGTASTVYTVNLGGTEASTYNLNALRFSGGAANSLTLTANGQASTVADRGMILNVLANNSITIPSGKIIHLSGAFTSATQAQVGSNQVNQIIGSDANSVIVNGGITCNPRQNGTAHTFPFGAYGSISNIVVFNSGSTFTNGTTIGWNPWGGTAGGLGVAQFNTGSTYTLSGTSTLFTVFGGRTLGTLKSQGGGPSGTATLQNGTSSSTIILDSLVISSAASSFILYKSDASTAVPAFNINSIRVRTVNTAISCIIGNNGTTGASHTIYGDISVSSTGTGNASVTFGSPTTNANNTVTNILLTGSGKTISTSATSSGTATIGFGTSGTSAAGIKTTNLIIDSTANINLNTNLNLTTTNITSNLTVRTKGVLSVGTGFTLTTNDKLTLQSTITGTGSIGNSAGTISGNTTVQRYVPANAAWRTIGLPFNGATFDGRDQSLQGSGTVNLNYFASKSPTWAYYYNEGADDGKYGTTGGVNAGWTAITTSTAGLGIRNGLLLYGSRNQAAYTLSDTGFINYGDQVIPLSKTVNGWNLIANPYPSNISFTSIVDNGSNAGILNSNTVYRVNPLGNGAYSWASYVSGSGTGSNGGSNVIENGAAFFVQAASASTNLTIKETDKTTDAVGSTSGGVTLLGANENYNSIRVSLKGANTFTDEVVFVWGRFSKATEGFDNDLDAYDLGASGTHDLSIVDKEGTRYAIFNGADLPKDAETRTYKLATKNLRLGTYEFAVSMPKALDRNNEAYLVDNYLGTAVLVKEGLSHSFQVTADAASKAEGRFQLEIRKKLTSAIDEVATSKTYLLSNPTRNNQFAIHFGSDAQVANWQVVDLSGRVVSTGMFKNVYQGDTRIGELKTLQPGTYLVRLFNDNEPTVVMKLVKL